MNEILEKLTIESLKTILGLESAYKYNKSDLIEMVREKIEGNEILTKRIFRDFSVELAMRPSDVEKILKCTKAERNRWTNDGKLKLSHMNKFNKWGRTIKYPMYDRYFLMQITPNHLEAWRREYEETKKINSVKASQRAKETETANAIKKNNFNNEWREIVKQWSKEDMYMSAAFQLAYWTVLVSRWANEYHLKTCGANVRKKDEYNVKKRYYYGLKDKAIMLLTKTPFARISFYRPDDPDKMDLCFCDKHYEDWVDQRSYAVFMDRWMYFGMNEEIIRGCPDCKCDIDEDYYSFYYIEIEARDKAPDSYFKFYIPYPKAKQFLPNPSSLNMAYNKQKSNDSSLLRFGRILFENEKIIYSERTVTEHFEEAMATLKMYVEKEWR